MLESLPQIGQPSRSKQMGLEVDPITMDQQAISELQRLEVASEIAATMQSKDQNYRDYVTNDVSRLKSSLRKYKDYKTGRGEEIFSFEKAATARTEALGDEALAKSAIHLLTVGEDGFNEILKTNGDEESYNSVKGFYPDGLKLREEYSTRKLLRQAGYTTEMIESGVADTHMRERLGAIKDESTRDAFLRWGLSKENMFNHRREFAAIVGEAAKTRFMGVDPNLDLSEDAYKKFFPDISKEELAMARRASSKITATLEEDFKVIKPVMQMLANTIAAETEEGSPFPKVSAYADMDEAIAAMSKIPKGQLPQALEMMTHISKHHGWDVEKVKNKLWQKLDRGVGKLFPKYRETDSAEMADTTRDISTGQRKGLYVVELFDKGGKSIGYDIIPDERPSKLGKDSWGEVFKYKRIKLTPKQAEAEYPKVSPRGVASKNVALPDRESVKVLTTFEDQRKAVDWHKEQEMAYVFEEEVKDWRDGVSVVKGDNWFTENFVYGVLGSVPEMAAAATGVPGVFLIAEAQAERYQAEQRRRDPTGNWKANRAPAMIAGLGHGLLGRLQFLTATKALPSTNNFFKGMMTELGKRLVLETAQETAQDLTHATTVEFYSAFDTDVKDFDLKTEMGDAIKRFPKTMLAVSPLVLAGVAGAKSAEYITVKDFKRYFNDEAMMTYFGADMETQAHIRSLPIPEALNYIQANYKKITENMTEIADVETDVAITAQEGGTFKVTKDGRAVETQSAEEAAEAAIQLDPTINGTAAPEIETGESAKRRERIEELQAEETLTEDQQFELNNLQAAQQTGDADFDLTQEELQAELGEEFGQAGVDTLTLSEIDSEIANIDEQGLQDAMDAIVPIDGKLSDADVKELRRLENEKFDLYVLKEERFFLTSKAGPQISPKEDAAYIEAANSGESGPSEKLVAGAAKNAGFRLEKVYHGSNESFTEFDPTLFGSIGGRQDLGFFFSGSAESASGYEGPEGSTQMVYLRLENPKVMEAPEHGVKQLIDDDAKLAKIIEAANVAGHDGVILRGADRGADLHVAFYPSQIKSAEPITRDDNGNIIPLSKRFDLGNDVRGDLTAPKTKAKAKAAPTRELGVKTKEELDSRIAELQAIADAVAPMDAPTLTPIESPDLNERERHYLGDRVLLKKREGENPEESDPNFRDPRKENKGVGGMIPTIVQPNIKALAPKLGKVFHETGLASLDQLIPPFTFKEAKLDSLLVSGNMGLAHGEGGKGYVLHIDTSKVNGSRNLNPAKSSSTSKEFLLEKSVGGSLLGVAVKGVAQIKTLRKRVAYGKIFDFDNVVAIKGADGKKLLFIPTHKRKTKQKVAKSQGLTKDQQSELNNLQVERALLNEDVIAKTKAKAAPKTIPAAELSRLSAEAMASPETLGAKPITWKLSPEPTLQVDKPVSHPEITKALEGVLKAIGSKTPIRFSGRKVPKRASAVYFLNQKMIRVRKHNDVTSAAHEVAHAIEDQFLDGGIGDNKWLSVRDTKPGMAAELVKMGNDLYNGQAPANTTMSEGFAEYFRMFVEGHDMDAIAPLTHRWFNKKILKSNPHVAKAVELAKKKAVEFAGEGALLRGEAGVVKTKGRTERMKTDAVDFIATFGDKFIDMLFPIKRIAAAAEAQLGEKLGNNPYETASQLRMTHDPIVKYMVEEQMRDFVGNPLGPDTSLKAATELIGDKRTEFTIYLWARRTLALDPSGRESGLSLDDANKIFKELNSPTFELAAKRVYDWQNNVLQYAADSSADYAQVVETIRTVDPGNYIPLFREFDTLDKSYKGGSPSALGAQLVKRLKGSTRRIKDPFESMITQARSLVLRANQRAVIEQVLDITERVPDMGQFMFEVSPDTIPVAHRNVVELLEEVTRSLDDPLLKDVSKALKDAVADSSQGEQMVTLWGQAYMPPNKLENPIIPIFRDGKRRWYEVDRTAYDALMGMEVYRMPKLLDIVVGIPNRMFKLGTTGFNASFAMVTNLLRDVRTVMLNTQSNKMMPELLGTWAKTQSESMVNALSGGTLVNTAWQDIYRRMGLEMSTALGEDSNPTKVAARRLFHGKFLRTVHPSNILDYFRGVFQYAESGARITEMKLIASEIGWNPKTDKLTPEIAQRLSLAAKRVTTDFTAAGSVMRVVNQIIPFSNAQIQGVRAHTRAFQANPVKFALRGAYGSAAAIGLWLTYKDEEWWKTMPMKEKYNYTYIPFTTPDGKEELLRIPRAFEADGFFMALPVAMLDAIHQDDPEEAVRWAEEFVGGFTPSAPVLAKFIYEQGANKVTFFDSPIVPRSQDALDVEGFRHLQYGSHNTRLSIELGKIFDVSPRRIDHGIKNFTGGAGSDFAALFGRGPASEKDGVKRESQLSDMPVIGTLFSSVGQSSYVPKPIDELYTKLDWATANRRVKGDDETKAERTQRLTLKDATSMLSSISEIEKLEMKTNERRRLRAIKVKIATEAVESFNSSKSVRTNFQKWGREIEALKD